MHKTKCKVRPRLQAAARRREARRQTQEVDDRVRLGRARRTVAAAERALHTLEQQVPSMKCESYLRSVLGTY